MRQDPATCGPETTRAQAVGTMWERDCGMLPVVQQDGQVVGVITDRDVAIALGTRSLLASEVAVRDVISGDVVSCGPEDDVGAALSTRGRRQVRRLPVLDRQRRLLGVISLTDIARRASGTDVLRCAEIVCALQAVTEPHFEQAQAALQSESD
ncbi:MAG: CBS domain-containing protein [Planctomycetes bacterium]|nr:CBS domain-containing protein [Planctomycetota bacterium]